MEDRPLELWTVAELGKWLTAVDLGVLVPLFEAEEIDGEVLLTLGTDDFNSLGIKIGQRKKLEARIMALKSNGGQNIPPEAPSSTSNDPSEAATETTELNIDPTQVAENTPIFNGNPFKKHTKEIENTTSKKSDDLSSRSNSNESQTAQSRTIKGTKDTFGKTRTSPSVERITLVGSRQKPVSVTTPTPTPPTPSAPTPPQRRPDTPSTPSTPQRRTETPPSRPPLKIISEGRLIENDFQKLLCASFLADKTKYLLLLCAITFDAEFIKPLSGRILEISQTYVIFCTSNTINELIPLSDELSFLASSLRLRGIITSGLPNSSIGQAHKDSLIDFAASFIEIVKYEFPIYVAATADTSQPISGQFQDVFGTWKSTIFGTQTIQDSEEEEHAFFDKLSRFATFSTVVELFNDSDRNLNNNNIRAMEEGVVVYSFSSKDEHVEWVNQTNDQHKFYIALKDKYPQVDLPRARNQTIRSNSRFRVLVWAHQASVEDIKLCIDVYRRKDCLSPVLINLDSYERFDYELFRYKRTRANIFPNVTRDFVRMAPLRWSPTISEDSTTNWEGRVSVLKLICYELIERSSNDPFVQITCGQENWTTTTHPKNRQPTWPGQGEVLNISLDDISSNSKITFSVFDHVPGKFGSSCEVAGKCSVKIRHLVPEFPSSQSFILEKSFILKPMKKEKEQKSLIFYKGSTAGQRKGSDAPSRKSSAYNNKTSSKHEKLKLKGFDQPVHGFVTITMQFDKAAKTSLPRYFGLSLKDSLANAIQYKTFHPVNVCIDYLKTKASEEGIIREVGDKAKVRLMKDAMDRGAYDKLGGVVVFSDHKEVVSLLKLYLSSLPDSLFTYQLFTEVQDVVQMGEGQKGLSIRPLSEDDLQQLRSALQRMPEPNITVFSSLMELFFEISEAQKKLTEKQMTAGPLGIAIGITVFVPDHIKSSTPLNDMIELSAKASRTLQAYIENWNKLKISTE